MKEPKIFVVSYDAGGANILSSLIKKYRNNFNWVTCISGPARNIFLQKKINLYATIVYLRNNDIDGILKLQQPDFLLTGTGWGSDLEINFIKSAKKNKIKSASFLDDWGGYRERFGYPANWRINLPDSIFVGDRRSYKIALKNGFPKNILLQVENPYFDEIIKQANLLKQRKIEKNKGNKIRILYISGSLYQYTLKAHNAPHYLGYTEYEIVKDLLEIMKIQKKEVPLELKIRLHPSEKIDKYSKLLKNKEYIEIKKLISVSNPAKNSLIKDCVCADIVVGSSNTALFVALIIGKKAISYVPNNKGGCSLPQKKIKKIYSMDKLIREIKIFKFKRNHYSDISKDNKIKVKNLFCTAVSKIIGN